MLLFKKNLCPISPHFNEIRWRTWMHWYLNSRGRPAATSYSLIDLDPSYSSGHFLFHPRSSSVGQGWHYEIVTSQCALHLANHVLACSVGGEEEPKEGFLRTQEVHAQVKSGWYAGYHGDKLVMTGKRQWKLFCRMFWKSFDEYGSFRLFQDRKMFKFLLCAVFGVSCPRLESPLL